MCAHNEALCLKLPNFNKNVPKGEHGVFCYVLLYTRDGLHFPVVIFLINEDPVDNLVLLLQGNEILNDQMSEEQKVDQRDSHRQMKERQK